MKYIHAASAAVAAGLTILGASAGMAAALTIDKQLILAEHNKYRTEVGVPPLAWSDRLAAGAQRWADTIALLDRMKHSGTSRIGENLAYWHGPNASLSTLIGMWEREKQLFQLGTFPNVSRDGNWRSVGHYTQMVWRATSEVGCAEAAGAEEDILVCRYSEAGNYIGERPF